MRRWLAVVLLSCGCALMPPARGAEPIREPDAAPSGSAASAPDVTPDRQLLALVRLPARHFRPETDYAGRYAEPVGRIARRRLGRALAQSHGLTLTDEWPMPALGLHCYVLALPPGASLSAALQSLSTDAAVAWAQPMHVYHMRGAPRGDAPVHDDPLYPLQPAASAWHLAELHAVATGRGIRVAVIDSGVDERHPDLVDRVVDRRDFVDPASSAPVAEAHGTAVAAIVAARADDGVGIAGVAPDARLLALRACRQPDRGPASCTTLTLATALQFALDHDAVVLNLSLAGPPDRLLAALIDTALARGIGVVAAVDTVLPDGGFPASHDGVIAVTDEAAGTSVASRWWLAPGGDVPTAAPGGGWAMVSGASYAAAHVTGLLALLRERSPRAGATAFVRRADGSLDACATLSQVDGACRCACATKSAYGGPRP